MSKKQVGYIVIAIIVIIVIMYANWYFLKSEEINDRGSFGDLFGASNTFFSGLAFVGLIAAIILQSHELKEQRNEFKLQNSTLKKQAFENTFYRLVSNSSEILDKIHNPFQEGKKLTEKVHDEIIKALQSNFYKHIIQYEPIQDDKMAIQKVSGYIKPVLLNYKHNFAPWIKSVANVSEFINESNIEDADKAKYQMIFFNQLSDFEVKILYSFMVWDVLNNEAIQFYLRNSPLSKMNLPDLGQNETILYFRSERN